ncbi:hypothetical protein [Nodosilinea sp. E11]|uniref:hypothetical protein n=1 Tax=Nodosilinea sp. E11 TaxID=3037479 RepID=UPI0029349436|nr:hypothetical protein [Nodosilinea sp. E11]WOD40362.1 hypothetical protein RRF56_06090 [Nodosilinea sp. E11]
MIETGQAPNLIRDVMNSLSTMQNYYPWNAKTLVEWLNDEFCFNDFQKLEDTLNIPKHIAKAWLTEPFPSITLAQIRLIAQYRGWKLDQMIEWLELKPAHVQELIDYDISQRN